MLFEFGVTAIPVQLMPSVEYIVRLVPLLEIATNLPFPYATDCQSLFAAGVRCVQFMPSGDVAKRLTAPLLATATNKPLPYVMAFN